MSQPLRGAPACPMAKAGCAVGVSTSWLPKGLGARLPVPPPSCCALGEKWGPSKLSPRGVCAVRCFLSPDPRGCRLGSPGLGPDSVHRRAVLRLWERPGVWRPGSAPPNPHDCDQRAQMGQSPQPYMLGLAPTAGRFAEVAARTGCDGWSSRCRLALPRDASASLGFAAPISPLACQRRASLLLLLLLREQRRSASGMRVACEMLCLLGSPASRCLAVPETARKPQPLP